MSQIIETTRLVLKPRTINEFQHCLNMDLDPAVSKYIPGKSDGSADHIKFLENRITTIYLQGLGYWSVFKNNGTSEFIGWIHLLPAKENKITAEIGWRLKRSAWGCGYAMEAATAILTYAFGELNIKKVVAYTHVDNVRSKKLMTRLGMRFVNDFMYEGNVKTSYYEISSTLYTTYEKNDRILS